MSPSNPFTTLSARTSSIPPQAPVSLLSLPIEAIKRIVSYLDRPSLLAFARLSRSFNSLTTRYIWEHLDLSFGSNGAISTLSTSEEVETANRAGLRNKIETILRRCSPSTLGMVRSVRVSVRPGCLHGVVQLLDYVSANVEVVEIGVAVSDEVTEWEQGDSIDCALLQYSQQIEDAPILHFPALTHVTLGRKSTIHHQFFRLLKEIAPNLTFLAWTFDGSVPPRRDASGTHYSSCEFENCQALPLRTLRVDFANRGADLEEAGRCIGDLSYIFQHCPYLRKLAIRYQGPKGRMDAEDSGEIMAGMIGRDETEVDDEPAYVTWNFTGLHELEELHWRGTSMGLPNREYGKRKPGRNVPVFDSLERLVIDHVHWGLPATSADILPHSQALKVVHFDCTLRTGPPSPSSLIHRSPDAQLLPPQLAKWLHANPELAKISFFCLPEQYDVDNFDIFPVVRNFEDDMTGHVSSLRYGDSEIMHVRLLLQDVEIAEADGPAHRGSVIFAKNDGKLAEHVEQVLDVHWQDYTFYRGIDVPLGILEAMREAEGTNEEDWRVRGLEVGDEAWAVFQAWMTSAGSSVGQGSEEAWYKVGRGERGRSSTRSVVEDIEEESEEESAVETEKESEEESAEETEEESEEEGEEGDEGGIGAQSDGEEDEDEGDAGEESDAMEAEGTAGEETDEPGEVDDARRDQEDILPPLPIGISGASRLSLTSLPLEIITRILQYLPSSALANLALVCRGFALPAEPYLWAHVDLSYPHPSPADLEYEDKAVAYYNQSKRRVDLITQLSTEKRLAAVKSLTIKPCHGAVHASITLLSLVASNLVSLVIASAAPDDGWRAEWEVVRCLDCRLMDYGEELGLPEPLSSWCFPCLTTLTIHREGLIYLGIIPFLCSYAPNLTTLALSFSTVNCPRTTLTYPSIIDRPGYLTTSTKIRHMRIDFDYFTDCWESSDESDTLPFGSRMDHWWSLIDLVDSSPELVRLSFRFTENGKSILWPPLRHFNALEKLRDLDFRHPRMVLCDEEGVEQDLKMESVRRLVVEWTSWLFPSTLPASLQLEIVHLQCSSRTTSPEYWNRSPDSQPIDQPFARWLRSCPRLHTLDFFRLTEDQLSSNPDVFDILDRAGETTCRIRSICHRGSELLLVSALLQDVDIVSYNSSAGPRRSSVIFTRSTVTDEHFVPTWQTYSDFGGRAVPMEVVRRMREVEGLSGEDDWQGRGVEVREAAWEVLMDWQREAGKKRNV